MNFPVPRARGRNPVPLPVQWQDCAWQPRMVVRPGGPGWPLLNLGQPRLRRRTRGYRRLLKGPYLRSLSRALRRNSGSIHFWRSPLSRKTIL